jgi:hypothetical protein
MKSNTRPEAYNFRISFMEDANSIVECNVVAERKITLEAM